MKIYRGHNELPAIKKPVVTIGTFDGVHKGHQKVLAHLREIASHRKGESLVITFWPHPRQVLNTREDMPKLLNSLENKILLFEKASIEHLLILEFNLELSRKNPQDFIREFLMENIKIDSLVIGYDHRFGRNRTGSFNYLKEKSKDFGFNVYEVPAFQLDHVSISSSKIRHALQEGDIQTANQYLGYTYFFDAIVERGLSIGKTMDFPTANLKLKFEDKQLPADGVYVVSAEIDGKLHYGMLNSGNNPTFPGKGRSIEIHLFDFEQDIYEQYIRISFLKRLRDEVKYENISKLKEQLHKDKQEALAFLKHNTL